MPVQTSRRPPSLDDHRSPMGGGPTIPTQPRRGADATPPRKRPRRKDPLWARLTVVFGAVLMLTSGVAIVGSKALISQATGNIAQRNLLGDAGKTDAEGGASLDGAIDMLLLGVDARERWAADDVRSDSIIVLHIPASHDRAYLVSIPRDLWVYIPPTPDGQMGGTMAKINAAYAWGGMPLAVQTVELYTGVHIDHVVVVDFAGFVKVTDAVGGVDMYVEQTISSIHPPYRTFEAGMRHFTGEEALDYVRQRYQFPEGDFARMRHQQMFLKALMDKATSLGTLANLSSLRAFVSSVADALTVDESFSLVDLAWQFRGLRSDDLVFLVSPNLGSDMIGDQSVVVSDRERALSFYEAMARDELDEWVSVHGTGW